MSESIKFFSPTKPQTASTIFSFTKGKWGKILQIILFYSSLPLEHYYYTKILCKYTNIKPFSKICLLGLMWTWWNFALMDVIIYSWGQDLCCLQATIYVNVAQNISRQCCPSQIKFLNGFSPFAGNGIVCYTWVFRTGIGGEGRMSLAGEALTQGAWSSASWLQCFWGSCVCVRAAYRPLRLSLQTTTITHLSGWSDPTATWIF